MRKTTRKIRLKDIYIGGNAPITVQSMTNTDTRDIDKTISQILSLEKVGCEIIRVAIPDEKAIKSIKPILNAIKIPLIADIHFDYKLAIHLLIFMNIILLIDGIHPCYIHIDKNNKNYL